MSTTITPVEIDGQHYIDVVMDGCELERRGPFDAGEAEGVAARIAAVCRVFRQQVAIGIAPTAAKRRP